MSGAAADNPRCIGVALAKGECDWCNRTDTHSHAVLNMDLPSWAKYQDRTLSIHAERKQIAAWLHRMVSDVVSGAK